MNFESFCEIENHFERGLYDHQDPLINVYLKSLVLFSQGHFDDFYKCLSERNLQTETFEKACGLILMILASESQYDLVRREKLLAEFHHLCDQYYQPLFEYYRMLFKAVGYAFQSLQIEAMACYSRSLALAELMNYSRGTVRSLMGLGLIHKELKNQKESENSFKKALSISQINGFQRSINKIKLFLSEKAAVDKSHNAIDIQLFAELKEIQKLIQENDLVFARKRLIEAEVLRRSRGLHRRAFSFYVWAAVIRGLSGQERIYNRIFQRLDDRILKSQALKFLIDQGIRLSPRLENSLKIIDLELFRQVRNETIDLNHIKNIHVCILLKTLFESYKPISKAELFEKVFRISYDPVIHDAKIYKLIMQTRKQVGTDVIINHHGAYSFNKKFNFVG